MLQKNKKQIQTKTFQYLKIPNIQWNNNLKKMFKNLKHTYRFGVFN